MLKIQTGFFGAWYAISTDFLKKPPKRAAEAAEKITFGDQVTAAIPAGPYLNLKLDRKAFAHQFLTQVDGLAYRSEEVLVVEQVGFEGEDLLGAERELLIPGTR